MSRFDYVKYDERATEEQQTAKRAFQLAEEVIERTILSTRPKKLALQALEVSYMWVGKGIRDDQLARNATSELQESRCNS